MLSYILVVLNVLTPLYGQYGGVDITGLPACAVGGSISG